MKNKLPIVLAIAIVAVVAVACCIILVPHDDNSNKENTYSYYLNSENDAVITGLSHYENPVCKIPSEVDGNKVVAISDFAFANDRRFTQIDLPGTVNSIGNNAFNGCSNVKSIIYDGKTSSVLVDGKISGIDIPYGKDCFKDISMMSVSFAPNSENSIVRTTFTNIPSDVRGIDMDASLNNVTDIVFKNRFDVDSSSMAKDADFGTYGAFNNVIVRTYDANGDVISESTVSGIAVTAPHYNIAVLNATYPVLLFSLDLCHDDSTDSVKDSLTYDPTFIYLTRYAAYDWNKLPSNAQVFPMVTKASTTEGKMEIEDISVEIAKYIRELYELNSDSTFTLYCVDNWPELMLQYFVAENIPEENWDVHILTDGTGTAGYLNKAYGVSTVEEADQIYDGIASNWEEIKQYVSENGYDWGDIQDLILYTDHPENPTLNYFPFTISKEEPNVDWTTGRLRANENLTSVPADFVVKIRAEAGEVYTNNLLAKLTDEEAVAFKELYHFNDEMFKEARDAGKKIMIILGTSASGEDILTTQGNQSMFYAYVKLTMDFYGDDYAYYYKGHPGYPTSLYPHRAEALDALRNDGYDIIELDNSIAAEVIMFYNPDVYLSGWQSTTFVSVVDPHMACAIYGTAKSALEQTYAPMVDLFFTSLTGTSYHNIVLDADKKYILIEYNSTPIYEWQITEYNKHEIAIYNLTDDDIRYYKDDGTGNYGEVPA